MIPWHVRRADGLSIKLGCAPLRTVRNTSPAVSVVLPTFNRLATISQAIGSVLVLDEVAFELIVVDDGSTDGTGPELERLGDDRVTVIRHPTRQGANVARNTGVAHARAPIVAFLDSDDIYLPGRLEQPLSLLQQNPHIGIVLSSFGTEKGAKRTLLRMPQRTYSGAELLRLMAKHVLEPTTSGLTIRRDVLEIVGGFDPALKRMQDRDLVMRVALHTMGATIATPLWHKRWQVDGISSSRETYLAALIDLFDRHEIFQHEERAFRDYLITRHLLAQAKSIDLRRLWRDYAEVRRLVVPKPPPLPQLITRYIRCHRERRRLKSQLLSGGLLSGTGRK